MRRRTDEVCDTCGSLLVYCDECYRDFCGAESSARECPHPYEEDDE